MDETPRTERERTTAPPAGPAGKTTGGWMGWALGLFAIVFLAAFIWQFYEAYTTRGELDEVEQELAMERLRVHLGQAALSAQSGNYEAARSQMSTFFTRLQEEGPAMTPEVRGVAEDFLTMRDDVITGLSRGNPEYGGVLYGMLETLGSAIDESLDTGRDAGMPTGGGPPAPEDDRPDADQPAAGAPDTGATR